MPVTDMSHHVQLTEELLQQLSIDEKCVQCRIYPLSTQQLDDIPRALLDVVRLDGFGETSDQGPFVRLARTVVCDGCRGDDHGIIEQIARRIRLLRAGSGPRAEVQIARVGGIRNVSHSIHASHTGTSMLNLPIQEDDQASQALARRPRTSVSTSGPTTNSARPSRTSSRTLRRSEVRRSRTSTRTSLGPSISHGSRRPRRALDPSRYVGTRRNPLPTPPSRANRSTATQGVNPMLSGMILPGADASQEGADCGICSEALVDFPAEKSQQRVLACPNQSCGMKYHFHCWVRWVDQKRDELVMTLDSAQTDEYGQSFVHVVVRCCYCTAIIEDSQLPYPLVTDNDSRDPDYVDEGSATEDASDASMEDEDTEDEEVHSEDDADGGDYGSESRPIVLED